MKMKNYRAVGLLLCGVVSGSPSWAAVQSAQPSAVENSRTMQTQVQTTTQQAGQWGLGPEEMQRYRELMAGPRGVQSPGLDPLSTLGIEARSDAERREYADKWVRAEFARTEKELRFQREVNAAWQRLYPQVLPVSMGSSAGIAHDTGGRLALFVRAKDCTQCDARLSAVLADPRPVDIYLVDSRGDDAVLRQWAGAHRIPPERVRQHSVTLNHDGGLWMRVGSGLMPVVLQQGSDGWHIAAY
jgi:integrating conjugative element protein (TIGR03759 family)